jgi:hypothetical protein
MPEFYTYHRTQLSEDFYAVDYAIRDNEDFPGLESSVKIFNKENKLMNKITIPGEIQDMCYIKKTGLLAIVTEESYEVNLYDPRTEKHVICLPFNSHVHELMSTDEHLIVSVLGIIVILDNVTLDPYQVIHGGVKVNKMSTLGNYLFCCVWHKDKTNQMYAQAKIYDYKAGKFVRDIGGPTYKLNYMGVLEDGNVFITMPQKSDYAIYVYCSKTGNQLNMISIDNSGQLFICPLPLGGIAISCDEEITNKVTVYQPFENKPSFIRENIPSKLFCKEDMILFILNQERESTFTLLKGTIKNLSTLGLFPAPVDCLIADYSISREALEQKEVDGVLKRVILK